MVETAKKIIREKIIPLMEKKGVKELGDDVYAVDGRAVKVEYNSEKEIFELSSCPLTEDGEPDGEWNLLVNWLFDSNSDERDAKSVANEFEAVLQKELEIKPKRAVNAALPKKGEKGGVMDTEALAHKFLVIYPEHKADYNDMMEKYGVFLPEEFFTKYGRDKIAELINSGNKKGIKKLTEVLNGFYEDGTPEVRSIITATILSKLADFDEDKRELMYENMSNLLLNSTKEMVRLSAKKNK